MYLCCSKPCLACSIGVQGGWGVHVLPLPPQILVDQITLFKPRGQIMPITLLHAPPIRFSELPTDLKYRGTDRRKLLSRWPLCRALYSLCHGYLKWWNGWLPSFIYSLFTVRFHFHISQLFCADATMKKKLGMAAVIQVVAKSPELLNMVVVTSV